MAVFVERQHPRDWRGRFVEKVGDEQMYASPSDVPGDSHRFALTNKQGAFWRDAGPNQAEVMERVMGFAPEDATQTDERQLVIGSFRDGVLDAHGPDLAEHTTLFRLAEMYPEAESVDWNGQRLFEREPRRGGRRRRRRPDAIDPYGENVIDDGTGILLVLNPEKPKPSDNDLVALMSAYPDAVTLLWGDEELELQDTPLETFVPTGSERQAAEPRQRRADRQAERQAEQSMPPQAPAADLAEAGESRRTEGFTPAQTASEAQEFAASLGVEAHYFHWDDETPDKWVAQANTVNEALNAMSRNGEPLPEGVELSSSIFPATGPAARAVGLYAPDRGGRIFFNPNAPSLKDPNRLAAEARDGKEAGWWSSDDPYHVVRHEVGHMLHDKEGRSQYRSFNVPDKAAGFMSTTRLLAREVSRYAATNPNEFVAEVYTGLRDGNTYSESAMTWYETLGGPAV